MRFMNPTNWIGEVAPVWGTNVIIGVYGPAQIIYDGPETFDLRTIKFPSSTLASVTLWRQENADKALEAAAKEAAYIAARAPAGAIDPDDLAGDLILDVLTRAHKFDLRRRRPPRRAHRHF